MDKSKLFKRFLSNQKVEEPFKENLKDSFTGIVDYEEHLEFLTKHNIPQAFVDVSFQWSATKEGYDFWEKLHLAWLDICEKMVKK